MNGIESYLPLPLPYIRSQMRTDEAKDSQEAHFVHKDGCGDDLKVLVDEANLERAGKVCRVINLLNDLIRKV